MSADSEKNILYHLQLVTEARDSATWQKAIALRKQNQLLTEACDSATRQKAIRP